MLAVSFVTFVAVIQDSWLKNALRTIKYIRRKKKSKAVPLHAIEAHGGEKV
jgi:hypothetical protein